MFKFSRPDIRTFAAAASLALCALNCASTDSKLKEAAAAENTGKFRECVTLNASLALALTQEYAMPEPGKGRVIQPAIWQGEVERYIKWLTEPAAQRDNALRQSLDGLDRCAEHLEFENIVRVTSEAAFENEKAFAAHWNKAFNPPTSGGVDWDALLKSAAGGKFSVLKMTAPLSYSYEVHIISRKTARRVRLNLLAENTQYVPLSPGEYSVIVTSSVEFQKGQQRWSSEPSIYNVAVTDTQSLITLDFKTHVQKKT